MPAISSKGSRMPASPIRKLVPFADAAKKRGVKIYHLNIGQPDLPTPAVFWEDLKQLPMTILSYAPSDGYEDYKTAFADYYNGIGIKVDKSNFIITNGGSEALSIAMMSILDDGDEIIIPEPMYTNYIGFATSGNINVKPISCAIENGFALPPIEAFEALITPKTKAILICNPNNPTGYLYSKTELQTLRDIALKHDLFLITDEVYREFVYGDSAHFSALNLDGLDENVIVIDSISKRFSACGARVGALVSRNKQLMAAAMKFAQARLSPPSLGQLAGRKMFYLKDDYYSAIKKEYTHRRDVLVALLNAIPNVKCPNPGGAFYAVAELPVADADAFCQWMLEHFNYENETVMMAPASGFYATKDAGKNQVRLAYVLNEADIRKAIFCLQKGLEQYLQK